MTDTIKKDLEDKIEYYKTKLTELRDLLETLELQNQIIATKHATFQLTETFKELTWKEAMDLPRTLNEKKYLGFDDWYLPDVSEIFLMLEIGWKAKIKNKKYVGVNGYSQDDYIWSANNCKDHSNARRVDTNFKTVSALAITTKCSAICVRTIGGPLQDAVAEPAEMYMEVPNDEGTITV